MKLYDQNSQKLDKWKCRLKGWCQKVKTFLPQGLRWVGRDEGNDMGYEGLTYIVLILE